MEEQEKAEVKEEDVEEEDMEEEGDMEEEEEGVEDPAAAAADIHDCLYVCIGRATFL